MQRCDLPRPVRLISYLILFCCLATNPVSAERQSGVLAFGSCLRQWQPQPVWGAVTALRPDAFILVGDNVYTDIGPDAERPEPERIRAAYRELAGQPEFSSFRRLLRERGVPLLATWDDHDYGRNDAGADYPHRMASKQAFVEFFGQQPAVAADEPGIYRSQILTLAGLKVQVLLLDTRSFRSPLLLTGPTLACPREHPVAETSSAATVLGDRQWRWLQQQLDQTADLRLLVSSIQVLPTEHCFEKWANFPLQRQRLLALLHQSEAPVVILSGDRHLGEISALPAGPDRQALYEITSSGLNSAVGALHPARLESNSLRVSDDNVGVDNFASILIEAGSTGRQLQLRLHDVEGQIQQQIQLPLLLP